MDKHREGNYVGRQGLKVPGTLEAGTEGRAMASLPS